MRLPPQPKRVLPRRIRPDARLLRAEAHDALSARIAAIAPFLGGLLLLLTLLLPGA